MCNSGYMCSGCYRKITCKFSEDWEGNMLYLPKLHGVFFLKVPSKDLCFSNRNKREFYAQYLCNLCCKIREGKEFRNYSMVNNQKET